MKRQEWFLSTRSQVHIDSKEGSVCGVGRKRRGSQCLADTVSVWEHEKVLKVGGTAGWTR